VYCAKTAEAGALLFLLKISSILRGFALVWQVKFEDKI